MQGGGTQSQYGDHLTAAAVSSSGGTTAPSSVAFNMGAVDHQHLAVEAASPISSRPPATANLEDLMRLSSAASMAGGEEGDGGGPSGNRWPRQETLALLKIRSDMDGVFRDATIKGPLWEDISRKMVELGYKKRSGKKCKEKFENVQKYYKRTKEGRGARQDGKTYKFFTELEALHNTTPLMATTTSLDVSPVSIGLPMPIPQPTFHPPPATISIPDAPPPPSTSTNPPPVAGLISFSSDTNSASSSDHESSDYDNIDDDMASGSGRKRKRSGGGGGDEMKMMGFFENLMKQVMQKQERMQNMFLEAIEKREQDRMIRDEAWKRQETARIQQEHNLMAQERAVSASRDAAILSFIHKFTGQTIQLPPVPPPAPPPAAAAPPPHPQPSQLVSQLPPPAPASAQQYQTQPQIHRQKTEMIIRNETPAAPEVVVGEQQADELGGGSSSRWPKAEVEALIKLRSGLENRYQDAGPKGPLWEEISSLMLGMGYKRNAKRCKEKWENINKYFKKVKESSKKRPQDSKTCPYFHQLDALYQKKVLIGTTSSGGGSGTQPPPQQQPPQQEDANVNLNQQPAPSSVEPPMPISSEMESKNLGLFGEGTTTIKPEAIVKELMGQGMMLLDDETDHELDSNYDIEEEDDDIDHELEGDNNNNNNYKIEYQRSNTSNGAGAPFLAMVQ